MPDNDIKQELLNKIKIGKWYEIKEISQMLPYTENAIYKKIIKGYLKAYHCNGRWKVRWDVLRDFIIESMIDMPNERS